jgi:ubiquinol-cytochrome c reductase cytochrome c subunit
MTRIFFLLLTLAGVLAAQDGNADNGKKLFARFGCYECHGYMGQGGSAGARIARTPLTADRFMAYVRHPTGQMPPYTAKVVTDAELVDIRAYLVSIPAPQPVKNIPLLNQ